MTLPARTIADAEALERRWNGTVAFRWRCWCGRVLGCPAALDAHQIDHERTA